METSTTVLIIGKWYSPTEWQTTADWLCIGCRTEGLYLCFSRQLSPSDYGPDFFDNGANFWRKLPWAHLVASAVSLHSQSLCNESNGLVKENNHRRQYFSIKHPTRSIYKTPFYKTGRYREGFINCVYTVLGTSWLLNGLMASGHPSLSIEEYLLCWNAWDISSTFAIFLGHSAGMSHNFWSRMAQW